MAEGAISVSGVVHVDLPPEQAFELFTPSGERRWAEGWDPIFPTAVDDETAPGTVFEIDHGGVRSTWVVVERDAGRRISYARVTPGDRAGLVTVECRGGRDGSTEAHVTYVLTALGDGARASLAAFAAHYPQFLDHWRDAISDAVKRG